jgi:hypothetical protein
MKSMKINKQTAMQQIKKITKFKEWQNWLEIKPY